MSLELSITVKDAERNLKKKFLVYDRICLAPDDPVIQKCVKETLDEFKGDPDDIKLRTFMSMK